MKRVLCTVAAIMIATTAFAGTGDMTPQQAMEKMMKCPVCSAWNAEPALGPTLRYSVTTTKTGYIETLQTADESMKPAFDKCAAECEKRAQGIPSMSKEQKDMLCPLCIGHMKLMDRKDVTFEQAGTPMGFVMVGTSAAPEGVQALHAYSAHANAFAGLIAQASKDMAGQANGKKDVMKANQ
jgi:hypothetical protein